MCTQFWHHIHPPQQFGPLLFGSMSANGDKTNKTKTALLLLPLFTFTSWTVWKGLVNLTHRNPIAKIWESQTQYILSWAMQMFAYPHCWLWGKQENVTLFYSSRRKFPVCVLNSQWTIFQYGSKLQSHHSAFSKCWGCSPSRNCSEVPRSTQIGWCQCSISNKKVIIHTGFVKYCVISWSYIVNKETLSK
jgi:hypothetical protein